MTGSKGEYRCSEDIFIITEHFHSIIEELTKLFRFSFKFAFAKIRCFSLFFNKYSVNVL